ncbi:MAG: hypothetical protein EZS28_004307 [Streblomastix strix]|uniref:PHD-type domain-containing protein n=1 Tax=Streblomastix strix TaxID=222440 RepID=A0A5J4WZA0_9EUKA|nr:MAG: hypothetical protein EZS28_004307 [Streblomastix strix]
MSSTPYAQAPNPLLGTEMADASIYQFNPQQLFCVCKNPYVPGQFMIQCDGCNDWYHGMCSGITPEQANKMETFFCRRCRYRGSKRRVQEEPSDHLEPVDTVRILAQWEAEDEMRRLEKQQERILKRQNIRPELIRHLESILKQAISLSENYIADKIALIKTQGKDRFSSEVSELPDLQLALIEIRDLLTNSNQLRTMTMQIEQSMFDNFKSERCKAYREQYKSIRDKLLAPQENDFRLRVLRGIIPGRDLGNMNYKLTQNPIK